MTSTTISVKIVNARKLIKFDQKGSQLNTQLKMTATFQKLCQMQKKQKVSIAVVMEGQYPGRKKLSFFKFSFMTLYDLHYIEDLVSVKDAKLSSFGKGVGGFN